jgi:hypothetical protein
MRAIQSPGPVSGRTGAQRNGASAGRKLTLDIDATPLCDCVLEDGDEVLAQAERVPEEIGELATAVERLDRSEQHAVRTCPRPRGAWSHTDPNSRPRGHLTI